MESTIEVNGVRKRFGQALALDGLSFQVAPGSVTGFVGPNGAGKSTTMRVILGLDAVDEGTALIGGQPYASLRHPLRHELVEGGRERVDRRRAGGRAQRQVTQVRGHLRILPPRAPRPNGGASEAAARAYWGGPPSGEATRYPSSTEEAQ